jgi:pSer/pThr/pTyr-binding forkhead associated (FHA) protein
VRLLSASAVGSRPAQLKQVIEAERDNRTFLVVEDPDGGQLVAYLEPEDERITLGRGPECDLVLENDERVSRTHALLERVGSVWIVTDDGLSRNGTFVNCDRVVARRRLRDGDRIRVGATTLAYRTPSRDSVTATATPTDNLSLLDITPMQRKVLVALCAPFAGGRSFEVPATNQEIAEELVLSVDAVKTHMRAIFARFRVQDLPQNAKRQRVAEIAMRLGLVTERDLAEAAGKRRTS